MKICFGTWISLCEWTLRAIGAKSYEPITKDGPRSLADAVEFLNKAGSYPLDDASKVDEVDATIK